MAQWLSVLFQLIYFCVFSKKNSSLPFMNCNLAHCKVDSFFLPELVFNINWYKYMWLVTRKEK